MNAQDKAKALAKANVLDVRAAVSYRGLSAKQRHALRRSVDPEVLLNGSFREGFDLSRWPLHARIERKDHKHLDLIVSGQSETVRIPCRYFRGYCSLLAGVDHSRYDTPTLTNVANVLGFDQRLCTLWLYEINDLTGVDPLIRALKGLIRQSICDLHLLDDGSVIRVYPLDGDVLVEVKRPSANHVELNGIESFLKARGVQWDG